MSIWDEHKGGFVTRENTSKYAILGMLTFGPRSGYDLRREIEASISHFWSESYGQVYPVLRDLVAAGLATVTVEPGDGRPDRKVYTITNDGLNVFRHWLKRPAPASPNRNELLLKLFFGRQVSNQDLMAVVQQYRDQWAAGVAEWEAIAGSIQQTASTEDLDSRDRLFTLRYGELIGRATIAWADEVLATLQTDV